MQFFSNLIFTLRDLLWSGPFIIILLGAGIYLSFYLKGIQFRHFGTGFKKYFSANKSGEGDISSFQALMTALAGAIGTGNIAGIAAAVVIGGFGSLFWMWLVAFIGMATAYSETLLGLKYRQTNEYGEASGGPMYTLKNALNAKTAATLFAVFGVISSFGYCLVQSNSVVDAIENVYCCSRLPFGIGLAAVTGLVIIAGIKSIGRVAGILVPFMALAYLSVGIFILAFNFSEIIPAFKLIITSAFKGQAAIGGFVGSSLVLALQNGAQFGIFANEAGLGSFAMAGASSKNEYPAEQGMLAISGVFIATMVVCTITGLVLAVTNVLGTTDAAGKIISGSPLAISAFSSVNANFKYVVLIGLILFAFTTLLAWAYYGEKCIEFLVGAKKAHLYRWFYLLVIVAGSVLELELVWALAHLANGLMTLPNLYGLVRLAPVVRKETETYLTTQNNLE